jgi:hypothetical protein
VNRIAINSLGQALEPIQWIGFGSLPHGASSAMRQKAAVLRNHKMRPPGHFPNFGLKPNFRIWPAGEIALNQSFLSQLQGVRLWHRHCLSLTGIESLAG